MKRYAARVTSKGQLPLPARLRQALSLRPGDKVVFVQDEQGRIVLEAQTGTLGDLRGAVRVPGHVSIEEWTREARAARADETLESLFTKLSR